jgi:gluconolactonase
MSRLARFTVPMILSVALPALAADSPFAPGAKPKLLLKSGAGEGPAWHPKLGLLMSGEGNINRYGLDGKLYVYRAGAGTNGLLFDRQGRLLLCQPKFRRVARLSADGRKITVLTRDYNGKRYNQPNDLAVDSKGRIYFSDPKYGPRTNMEIVDKQGKKVEGVYRIDADGTVTRIITHEVDRPNGLLVYGKDDSLFVADNNNDTKGGSRKLWRFRLKYDGTIVERTRKLIYDWGTGRGPDGMAADAKGNIYVAAGRTKPNKFETADKKGGIYVFNGDGKFQAFVAIPNDEVTNCAFGGKDLKTLYITAGGALWSIRTAAAGKVLWPKAE